MRMYDIIAKKRDGAELGREEINYLVMGYTHGDVPDYQMAAFLMAVFLRGMTPVETAALTDAMANSGGRVDLSAIEGVKADKHSTGGVGDKTTLVVAPLAAACGLKIAKMSGRGLGHTGGTVDKLEAIPGFTVELPAEQFMAQVAQIGIAVVGQSGNLAPADKKIYALRDVTATVDSLPLIASSIMSKKLAAGADAILLDVKTGSGAFMKTLNDSLALAKAMVEIGEANGRRTAALITDMDVPLGAAIGNSLEVAEAVATLCGRGPADLTAVCLELCAGMLRLAGMGSHSACMAAAAQALHSGRGFEKLKAMVVAQGGDSRVIDDPSRFIQAKAAYELTTPRSGFIAAMDTERVGAASVVLGAGRERKEDAIDYAAGILLEAKTGSFVHRGDVIAKIYAATKAKAAAGGEVLLSALRFADAAPAAVPLVQARVSREGVELLA